MTVYRKCQPCKHRDDCDIKTRLSAAIKGFGVGTISHRCKSYQPGLIPGDNVWVRAQDVPHGKDWDNASPTDAEFPGHFVQYSKSLGRAIVYIAPGAESRCGDHSFEPANGKDGFCKVSYAPMRQKQPYSFAKGIIERREGRTALMGCCGLPTGTTCRDCSELTGWATI